jgi:hypothetical protein
MRIILVLLAVTAGGLMVSHPEWPFGRSKTLALFTDSGRPAKTPNGAILARLVMNATVRPDSPSAPWREKVIQMMKDRGVQFSADKAK